MTRVVRMMPGIQGNAPLLRARTHEGVLAWPKSCGLGSGARAKNIADELRKRFSEMGLRGRRCVPFAEVPRISFSIARGSGDSRGGPRRERVGQSWSPKVD
jgi:hypothetical protein